MSFGRIILLVLLGIFALPFIGAFVFNIAAAAYVMQMMGFMNSSARATAQPSDFGGIPIQPANAPGMAALVGFSEFHRTRTATLNIQMKPEDFRRGDKSNARVEDWDGYVATRLPAIGKEECAMLIKAFATQCAVTNISADRSGKFYTVRMTLAFTQREAFGTVKTDVKALNYVEIPANLNQKRDKSLSTERWVSQRRDYYTSIGRRCAAIKKENGNCAIHQVRITSTPDRKSSAVRVTAGSRFVVLQ